jgi:hypothetical protein
VQSYRDNNIYYYIGVEKEILEKLRSYLWQFFIFSY